MEAEVIVGLWDLKSGNAVGTFDSLDDAIEELRKYQALYGSDGLDDFVVEIPGPERTIETIGAKRLLDSLLTPGGES
jgi:hypothetical protein